MLNPRRWIESLANGGSGEDHHPRGWVEPSSEITRQIYASLDEDYEPYEAPVAKVEAAPAVTTLAASVEATPAVAAATVDAPDVKETAVAESGKPAAGTPEKEKEKHRGIRWRRKKQSKAA